MKKLISILGIIFVLISSFNLNVFADYSNAFSHAEQTDGSKTPILSKEIYTADYNLSASTFGLSESFEGITDICFDDTGKLYVLCGSISKMYIIDESFNTISILNVIGDNDASIDFKGAQGVFVDSNKNIYISDTEHNRVIVTDSLGKLIKTIKVPNSSLIPKDFLFQPTSIEKDNIGNMYIISKGCYYGALAYNEDGNFRGFYGANTVESTALDTLEYLWNRITSNDIKKSAAVKTLPYSFVDFSLDSEGYLLVCTGSTEDSGNGVGQIRKVSPYGTDILYSNSREGNSVLSSTINFLENTIIKKQNQNLPQNIVSVDVDTNNFIYALDKTYGLIYVYDDSCNILGAFGGGFGQGNRLGNFTQAQSLSVYENNLAVADYAKGSITIFKLTDYGALLKKAHSMYIKGQYNEAVPYWEKILSMNSGNQMAYKGIAMAKYYEGEYKQAIKYAKKGLDYSVYDLAYHELFKQFIKKYFFAIALLFVAIISLAIYFIIKIKKNHKKIFKNEKISIMFNSIKHPFNSFNDVKYKSKGSVLIACIVLSMFFISSVLVETSSGFLFSYNSPQSYNIFYTFLKTVGLIVLWSISNSLVTTLLGGKGTLKEVFIVSSYSLLPIIFVNFVKLILSYVLPLSGLTFLDGLYTVALIITFFVLSVAIMTVHEFDFIKFITTGILSVFGMLITVFVLFMIIIQLQQFSIFVSTIFMEALYR